MLHPDLDDVIRRIRKHGMIAGLLTNGYYLMPGPHPEAERGRTRPSTDQRRQRAARRCVAEKASRCSTRSSRCWPSTRTFTSTSIPCSEQDPLPRRRLASGPTRTGIRAGHDGRHHSRREWTVESAESSSEEDLRAGPRPGQEFLGRINKYNPFQDHLVKGKPNRWWWCRAGRALSLCLRGRARPLLLAAARASGDSSRAIHAEGHPAGVHDREGLRSLLHDLLRASGLDHRPLARPANPQVRRQAVVIGSRRIGFLMAAGACADGSEEPAWRARTYRGGK